MEIGSRLWLAAVVDGLGEVDPGKADRRAMRGRAPCPAADHDHVLALIVVHGRARLVDGQSHHQAAHQREVTEALAEVGAPQLLRQLGVEAHAAVGRVDQEAVDVALRELRLLHGPLDGLHVEAHPGAPFGVAHLGAADANDGSLSGQGLDHAALLTVRPPAL
jgi:hypothetical protein